jgi:uncharacterized surface protein with fasciclin (FAS1) repeats
MNGVRGGSVERRGDLAAGSMERQPEMEDAVMIKSGMLVAAVGLTMLGSGFEPQVANAGNTGKSESKRNIVQVAREAGTFKTLVKALEATGLVGTLSGQGQGKFTVFAPTDEAFAKLPAGTVESLLKDTPALKRILLYHVVPGDVRAAQVVAAATLPTVNGQALVISTAGGPRVNDANIVATDIGARNGVVHVIDTVLIPR